MIAKLGSGTGRFRLGACPKQANNKRTGVRNPDELHTIRTYEASMAERQYPQTPNSTTASMLEFVMEPLR